MRTAWLGGALAIGIGLATAPVMAQDYPVRPVTVVMPYAAGGPGDTLARILAQSLTPSLGQQVLVENIAGAGGSVGSAKVAASSPDGYTLLMIHISHATNPALYPKLKYDPVRDYEPIGLIVDLPAAFVAKKSIAASSFSELIDYVKATGDKLNYSHAGIGSSSHMCGLLFAEALNVKFTNVAYRGAGPAMNDMIGGQVDVTCDQIVNVVTHVEAGAIKGFATTAAERVAALPNLPTASEAGLPGFNYTVWYGLFAPKGTPKPVQDKLVGALNQAVADKNLRDRFAQLGAVPASQERASPAALAAHLRSEIDKWTPIIKAAGVSGAP